MRTFLLVLGTALVGYGIGFISGKDKEHSNIERRALKIGDKKVKGDTIYTQYDLEYIVFGESQL